MKGSIGVHSTPRRPLPHPRLRDCPCARHFAISSLLLSASPSSVSKEKKAPNFAGGIQMSGKFLSVTFYHFLESRRLGRGNFATMNIALCKWRC